MDHEYSKLMTPFDCQTTPHWIHLLKLMLPYTPAKHQHLLAVFIRFQEMQFTMRHFNGFGKTRHFDNIFNDVKPYMDPATQEMMEQMESLMNMAEMIQMMKNFSQDDSAASSETSGFNPLNILSGVTGSDLSTIFNMKGDLGNE